MMLKKLLFRQIMNDSIKDKFKYEDIKIIYIYRYLSWTLTSLAYIMGGSFSNIIFKIIVIISLLISSKVITGLYIKFKENMHILISLVLVETIGITFLLLPTGGLNSPFIWYALNPTLVSASYLPIYFCWVNLMFYLLVGTVMSYYLFNPNSMDLVWMFAANSNLILVFTLITLAVQLLSEVAKKLYTYTEMLEEQKRKMSQINTELYLSNAEKEESIDHIMSLYQMIEALNNNCSKEKLAKVLADYTAKLTKSDLSYFWLFNSQQGQDIIKSNKELNEVGEENKLVIKNLGAIKLQEPQEISIAGKKYLVRPILSPTSYFGLVAIGVDDSVNQKQNKQTNKLLQFIAELSAVTLERFHLEDIEGRLLILEEQNRIANEIHDGVSQRLFSISYAIHGILGRWDSISNNELKKLLIEIRESSNSSMQELRNSIYKLSSKKRGENSLHLTLRSFLDSIAKLNCISINFETKGDEELVDLPLKKAITRIISEACGNAIRHGQCKHIRINIEFINKRINISIMDDGAGFSNKKDELESHGLGLLNMSNLVNSFGGNIEIITETNRGTEINIIIPSKGSETISNQGEGVAI